MLLHKFLSLATIVYASAVRQRQDSNANATPSDSSLSFARELLEFVNEANGSLPKRDFTRSHDQMSFTWNQSSPDEQSRSYNITILLSGCSGVHRDTQIGIYTYVNGTTKENATMGDIVRDLGNTKRNAADLHRAKKTLTIHTLTVAQQLLSEVGNFLDTLLCPNATVEGSSSGDESPVAIVHSELRRLLWLPDRESLLKASMIIGRSAAVGGTVALATYRVQTETNHPFLTLPAQRQYDNTSVPAHIKPIIAGSATFICSLIWDLMSRAPFVDPDDANYAHDLMQTFVFTAIFSFGALFVLPVALAKMAQWLRTVKASPKLIAQLGTLDVFPSFLENDEGADINTDVCVPPDLASLLLFAGHPDSAVQDDAGICKVTTAPISGDYSNGGDDSG